jgi:hypothetical protein
MKTNYHLIYSGDIATKDVSIIQSFLSKVKGPLKFVSEKQSLKPSPANHPSHLKFHWDIQDLIKKYKTSRNFSTTNFLIAFTTDDTKYSKYTNSLDSIGINLTYYKSILGEQFYLPIVYVIVTSIIKAIISKDKDELNLKYTHYSDAEGCINAVLASHYDIQSRLKNIDVCTECDKRIKEVIPEEIESQLFGILEKVRKERIVRKPKEERTTPVKLALNSDDEIYIPDYNNQVIDLQPMEKTIFVFYLNNLNKGVRFKDLKEVKHQELLIKIYKRFCDKRDKDKVASTIDNVIINKSKAFSSPKTNLNKELKKIFKGELADKYTITGPPSSEYKILLPPDMIDQSLKF